MAVERLVSLTRELCEQAGWAAEDVDLVIPHQANQRIIEATLSRLDIPLERAVMNIERYGNTSAASIPLALSEAVEAGRLRHGQRVLMIAFGAGVTWGGVAMRWIDRGR
jgi:3-oxoacyl-[acyl-carrier-protein] synthase III